MTLLNSGLVCADNGVKLDSEVEVGIGALEALLCLLKLLLAILAYVVRSI